MTKDEALKLALDALKGIQRYGLDTLSGRVDGPDNREWQHEGVNEMTKRARLGITAIKKALAQPEQEPVGFAVMERPWGKPWVSLTKEEIDSALSKYQNWYEFAAYLENILKEKNQ